MHIKTRDDPRMTYPSLTPRAGAGISACPIGDEQAQIQQEQQQAQQQARLAQHTLEASER